MFDLFLFGLKKVGMAELLFFFLSSFLLHFVFQSSGNVLFYEIDFLIILRALMYFCMNFTPLELCVYIAHRDFPAFNTISCGSTVVKMGSKQSCFAQLKKFDQDQERTSDLIH